MSDCLHQLARQHLPTNSLETNWCQENKQQQHNKGTVFYFHGDVIFDIKP